MSWGWAEMVTGLPEQRQLSVVFNWLYLVYSALQGSNLPSTYFHVTYCGFVFGSKTTVAAEHGVLSLGPEEDGSPQEPEREPAANLCLCACLLIFFSAS